MEVSDLFASKPKDCPKEEVLKFIAQVLEQMESNAGLAKFGAEEEDAWSVSYFTQKVKDNLAEVEVLLQKLSHK